MDDRDIDGYTKSILDLLVRAGVLVDDRSDFVSSVTASFGDVEMCQVSVEAEPVQPNGTGPARMVG
jgi:Holliday junction resolvase RusA-like endonuclease